MQGLILTYECNRVILGNLDVVVAKGVYDLCSFVLILSGSARVCILLNYRCSFVF